MATNEYYLRLLRTVRDAGELPELAYQARTRLRRALLALERGRRGDPEPGPMGGSEQIKSVVLRLQQQALHICQPSEALDLRWRREWADVRRQLQELESLLGP